MIKTASQCSCHLDTGGFAETRLQHRGVNAKRQAAYEIFSIGDSGVVVNTQSIYFDPVKPYDENWRAIINGCARINVTCFEF